MHRLTHLNLGFIEIKNFCQHIDNNNCLLRRIFVLSSIIKFYDFQQSSSFCFKHKRFNGVFGLASHQHHSTNLMTITNVYCVSRLRYLNLKNFWNRIRKEVKKNHIFQRLTTRLIKKKIQTSIINFLVSVNEYHLRRIFGLKVSYPIEYEYFSIF